MKKTCWLFTHGRNKNRRGGRTRTGGHGPLGVQTNSIKYDYDDDDVTFKFDTDKLYERTISLKINSLGFVLKDLPRQIKKTGNHDIETIQKIPRNRVEVCFTSAKYKHDPIENGIEYEGKAIKCFDSKTDVLTVCVCGVPPEITMSELLNEMKQFGKITTRPNYGTSKKILSNRALEHFIPRIDCVVSCDWLFNFVNIKFCRSRS